MTFTQELQDLMLTMPNLTGMATSQMDPIINMILLGSFDRQPLLLTIGDALTNATDVEVRVQPQFW